MSNEASALKNADIPNKDIRSYRYSCPAAWMDLTGWRAEMRQIEAGVLETQFLTVTCPQVQFHDIRFNRSIHQQGLPSRDYVHFGIPNHQGRLKWQRNDVSAGSLICHNAPDGYEVLSDAGLKNYLVSIDRQLVEDLCVAFAIDCGIEKLISNNAVYKLTHNATTALLRQLQFLSQVLSQAVQQSHGPLPFGAIEDLQCNLPLLILETLNQAESNTLKSEGSASVRKRGLERALIYIGRNAREAITVQEVCKAASVNWRTLERAFKDQFDVTPKAYLKAVRLNGARKALLSADHTEKVANIANSWGFWHLSQFAADYKKLFGELPTASLRR